MTASEVSSNWALAVYKSMIRIRSAESLAAKYYLENKIFSFVHFCIGQELAPAAFGYISSASDRTFGNHRSHGHFIGKGGSPFKMFSEMLGKTTGPSSGKGGSMHLIDPEVGFSGTSPILSSSLPLAAGSAWAQKASSSNDVTLVYTGDGASEEGNFYETLNIAALWQLPLIIVLENNLYSVNSPLSVRRATSFSMENLVKSMGIDYFSADGTDPLSAMEIFRDCYNLSKNFSKPCVVEVRAFRNLAHSSPLTDDKLGYRVEDTVEVRERRDPIRRLQEYLEEAGHLAHELESIKLGINEDLSQALALAASGEEPLPKELFSGLYA